MLCNVRSVQDDDDEPIRANPLSCAPSIGGVVLYSSRESLNPIITVLVHVSRIDLDEEHRRKPGAHHRKKRLARHE